MAQMIVIYKTPKNSAAFDRHYLEVHLPLVRQLPGLRRLETNRGPIISLYGASDVHSVATLHFDSLRDTNAAFVSEYGRVCVADRQQLASLANDVQMFLFDTQCLQPGDGLHGTLR